MLELPTSRVILATARPSCYLLVAEQRPNRTSIEKMVIRRLSGDVGIVSVSVDFSATPLQTQATYNHMMLYSALLSLESSTAGNNLTVRYFV